MGIARSTYYDAAPAPVDDTTIVEAISAICDELNVTVGGGFAPSCVIEG
jgi:hypothetical protein